MGLTVVGQNLYWVNGQNSPTGAIQSIPIDTTCNPSTGVCTNQPKTVLAYSQLQGDLTSDGSSLYFLGSDPNDAGAFDGVYSVGLDGTGLKTLASGLNLVVHGGNASEIFVVGGNVYCGVASLTTGGLSVISVPVGGGATTALVQGLNVQGGYQLEDVPLVDSSGIYIFYSYPSEGGTATSLGYVPLSGGVPTALYTPTQFEQAPFGSGTWSGDFTDVGGTAYFIVDINNTTIPPFAGSFMKWTSPSGPATKIAATVGELGGLVGDAKGMFALVNGAGEAGIFRIDPTTGAMTPFWSGGAPWDDVSALDANNLYFASSETLYAKAR